jgi:hypothetical protein
VSIQAKAAVIGSSVIGAVISIRWRSSAMTRLASSNCRFLFSAMSFLPVSGGNLGAALSRRGGDNFRGILHSVENNHSDRSQHDRQSPPPQGSEGTKRLRLPTRFCCVRRESLLDTPPRKSVRTPRCLAFRSYPWESGWSQFRGFYLFGPLFSSAARAPCPTAPLSYACGALFWFAQAATRVTA